MYGVIGSTTRKLKKLYGSIGSVTRNIKKVYGVVGGVTRLIFSGDSLIKAQWTGVVFCQNNTNEYSSSVEAVLQFRTRTKGAINTTFGSTCGSLYYTSQIKVSADGMYCAMYGNAYVQIYKWNGSNYAKQNEFSVAQLFTKAGITTTGSFTSSVSAVSFSPNGSVVYVVCNNNSSHKYRDVLFFKNDASLTFIARSTCNETDTNSSGVSHPGYLGFDIDINSTIFSTYAYFSYDQYYNHKIFDIYKINADYTITRLVRSNCKHHTNSNYIGGNYTVVDPLGKYVIIGEATTGSANSSIQKLYYISGSTATSILTIPTGYITYATKVISSFDEKNLYILIAYRVLQ